MGLCVHGSVPCGTKVGFPREFDMAIIKSAREGWLGGCPRKVSWVSEAESTERVSHWPRSGAERVAAAVGVTVVGAPGVPESAKGAGTGGQN